MTGQTCLFPFTYKGQQFSACTTFDSENGQAWCATEVSLQQVLQVTE